MSEDRDRDDKGRDESNTEPDTEDDNVKNVLHVTHSSTARHQVEIHQHIFHRDNSSGDAQ